jgi:hypothetical protein
VPQGTDSYAQFNPPRPPRNPARNASYDPLDGETGTFLSGHDDDDEDIDDTAHGDAIGSYGRLDQEEYTAGRSGRVELGIRVGTLRIDKILLSPPPARGTIRLTGRLAHSYLDTMTTTKISTIRRTAMR